MEKWRQSLAALTRGAGLPIVSVKACALAFLATALTVPYFHFLLFHVPRQVPIRGIANPYDMLCAQSALLFIICLLSAMVGYGFKKRYGLPGFGSFAEWRGSLPSLLATGLFLMLASWMIFDRYFHQISPVVYPDDLVYLLSMPLNGSITDEMILRFGFVTIAVGLCRNRLGGVALAALFAAMLTEKYFTYIGFPPGIDSLALARFFLSFCINFWLGYLFVTRGLLFSMTVKLVMCLRYPLAVLAMG